MNQFFEPDESIPKPRSRGRAGHLSYEERLDREQKIWALRLKCYTQRAIATRLGLHHNIVNAVLKRLNTRALEQMSSSILRRKAEQVFQLEHIAQEAMEAWERSKEASKAVEKRIEPPVATPGIIPTNTPARAKETITTRVADQDGNQQYLHTAMQALAEIRKVLEMEKLPLVGEGGTLIMHQEIANTQQHVLVIGGEKEEYIERLRRLRGAIDISPESTS